jgi:hypothetical protein
VPSVHRQRDSGRRSFGTVRLRRARRTRRRHNPWRR